MKEENGEMEQMKRMSSTAMIKVQEDNAALKQLLSLVSSSLQKNACAVDKLKREMTQVQEIISLMSVMEITLNYLVLIFCLGFSPVSKFGDILAVGSSNWLSRITNQ